jgi:hypothetical protein
VQTSVVGKALTILTKTWISQKYKLSKYDLLVVPIGRRKASSTNRKKPPIKKGNDTSIMLTGINYTNSL